MTHKAKRTQSRNSDEIKWNVLSPTEAEKQINYSLTALSIAKVEYIWTPW